VNVLTLLLYQKIKKFCNTPSYYKGSGEGCEDFYVLDINGECDYFCSNTNHYENISGKCSLKTDCERRRVNVS
jgi:hypothetical protein